MELPEYTGKTERELREHIYIYIYNIILYISEISIDMNRECARFARSIISPSRMPFDQFCDFYCINFCGNILLRVRIKFYTF